MSNARKRTEVRSLREHYQKRDQLRLVVDYRRKYLESLIPGSDEKTEQAEQNYERARTQTDKDYEETAAAVDGWTFPKGRASRLPRMRDFHASAACSLGTG